MNNNIIQSPNGLSIVNSTYYYLDDCEDFDDCDDLDEQTFDYCESKKELFELDIKSRVKELT